MIADLPTERAVISTCSCVGIDAYRRACRILSADHFADQWHARMWQAMGRAERMGHVDTMSMRAHMDGPIDEDRLLAATSHIPDLRRLDEQCARLRDLSVARAVATAGATLHAAGQSCADDVREYLDTAPRAVSEALRGRVARVPGVSVADAAMDLYDHMGEMLKHHGVIGHQTGLARLDEITHGLMPGRLYVLAGRPGMGKSALALRMVSSVARAGHPVVVFSLEMGAQEWTARLLAADSAIPLSAIMTGSAVTTNSGELLATLQGISQLPIRIADVPSLDHVSMSAAARAFSADAGGTPGLIVVDYLQLMTGTARRGESREQEVSAMSRACKALAMELQCPVLALSQLNRKVDDRADHHPVLSDLRESGAIEQDADVVLMVYRDEAYNPSTRDKPNPKAGTAEIIVAKNRSGRCAIVECAWIAERCSFEPLAWDRV